MEGTKQHDTPTVHTPACVCVKVGFTETGMYVNNVKGVFFGVICRKKIIVMHANMTKLLYSKVQGVNTSAFVNLDLLCEIIPASPVIQVGKCAMVVWNYCV